MYGTVVWNAKCPSIVPGSCVGGNVNEGCEQLGEGQCVNWYRSDPE